MKTILLDDPQQWPPECWQVYRHEWDSLRPMSWWQEEADACCLLEDNQQLQAFCALWWKKVPPHPGWRPGTIGYFEARDGEAAGRLLHFALSELALRGCDYAIGPMHGNTWRRYRFVVDGFSEPPFLMEPWNPPEYPGYFEKAGFVPLGTYQSVLVTDLENELDGLAALEGRLNRQGFLLRQLDPAHFERDLRLIYDLSLDRFRHNYLYTDLGFAPFLRMYQSFRDRIRPEFVFLAEKGGRLAGFSFAIPDYLRLAAGHPLDTLVLKTAAVAEDCLRQGLGACLILRSHQAARAAGLRRCLHALSKTDNPVTRLSNRLGQVYRRYALYGRSLQA